MQHQFVWVDIPVKDLDRAIGFYSAVLGEKVSLESFPGFRFGLLPHADNNISGCLVEGPNNPPSGAGPLVYLNAQGRLQAAVDAAVAHGGTVLEPPVQIGAHGHRAVILDSEGNRIALHSPVA